MDNYENTYSEKHFIPSFMVDGKLCLTPTCLFGILQEVAVNHVNKVGCGWQFLHERRQFWALSRMDVEIVRRPMWEETVVVTTWGKKHNFLVQPRDFLVENVSGDVLVRATSNWVILDFEGKPCELSAIEPLLKNRHDLHAIEKPAVRLRQSVKSNGEAFYPVVYTNIDMNHHVNNSAYVTWVMDSFSNDFHASHELKTISLNYLMQTRPDDRYAVAKKEISSNCFLCSIYSEKRLEEVCRVLTEWV